MGITYGTWLQHQGLKWHLRQHEVRRNRRSSDDLRASLHMRNTTAESMHEVKLLQSKKPKVHVVDLRIVHVERSPVLVTSSIKRYSLSNIEIDQDLVVL